VCPFGGRTRSRAPALSRLPVASGSNESINLTTPERFRGVAPSAAPVKRAHSSAWNINGRLELYPSEAVQYKVYRINLIPAKRLPALDNQRIRKFVAVELQLSPQLQMLTGIGKIGKKESDCFIPGINLRDINRRITAYSGILFPPVQELLRRST